MWIVYPSWLPPLVWVVTLISSGPSGWPALRRIGAAADVVGTQVALPHRVQTRGSARHVAVDVPARVALVVGLDADQRCALVPQHGDVVPGEGPRRTVPRTALAAASPHPPHVLKPAPPRASAAPVVVGEQPDLDRGPVPVAAAPPECTRIRARSSRLLLKACAVCTPGHSRESQSRTLARRLVRPFTVPSSTLAPATRRPLPFRTRPSKQVRAPTSTSPGEIASEIVGRSPGPQAASSGRLPAYDQNSSHAYTSKKCSRPSTTLPSFTSNTSAQSTSSCLPFRSPLL